MTEAEWLTCEDPEAMIRVLVGPAHDRKLRLYACGCCRIVWELLTDKRSRLALRRLEQFADDQKNHKLWQDAYNIANAAFKELGNTISPNWTATCAVVVAAHPAVRRQRDGNIESALMDLMGLDLAAVMRMECELLRDIFGNPSHPVAFGPDWRTSTVLTFAQQMYDARDFTSMPILADVLQDSGCEDEQVLNHCREPGQHVRGCWVIDCLLEKESRQGVAAGSG